MVETKVGHCKKDETDVYIGRSRKGKGMDEVDIGKRGWLGNPYPLTEFDSRAASIEAFKADFIARLKVDSEFRGAVADLSGKTLGCWCQRVDEDEPACHGEVIAEWADKLNNHELEDINTDQFIDLMPDLRDEAESSDELEVTDDGDIKMADEVESATVSTSFSFDEVE